MAKFTPPPPPNYLLVNSVIIYSNPNSNTAHLHDYWSVSNVANLHRFPLLGFEGGVDTLFSFGKRISEGYVQSTHDSGGGAGMERGGGGGKKRYGGGWGGGGKWEKIKERERGVGKQRRKNI